MYCQLSFSQTSFGQLIKYRIADSFIPLTDPVPFPNNSSSWLDGIIVRQVIFNRIEHDREVILNEGLPGAIKPNFNSFYSAGALKMDVAIEVFFAKVSDVASAGLNQPAVESVFTNLQIAVRMLIGIDGIPTIQMVLDTAPLIALGLPASVIANIASAGTANMPYDIGKELGEMFPEGSNKILNAGITMDDHGSIVMRFEFTSKTSESLTRISDWTFFFSKSFVSNLGNNDWCMDVDGFEIAKKLSEKIGPMLKNEGPIKFTGVTSCSFGSGNLPVVSLTKPGMIENACSNMNIDFDANISLSFSVPSNNMLRATMGFDFDKNDFDMALCFGVVLLNPLSIFITALDNDKAGLGFGELALSLIVPTKLIAVGFLAGMLIFGVDQDIANEVIAERLKGDPKVTKLPDNQYAFDKAMAPKSELTKDWLVLKNCAASGQRMLLTGEFKVPDAVLPKLTATDLEGFSKWVLIDKCVPGKGQITKGSLALTLNPGYGAALANIQPVKVPTIPFKWGKRSDGGYYEIVNDSLGVFQGVEKISIPPPPSFTLINSEYSKIYVPGVPGVVEVELKASTLRKPDFLPFASSPYGLRIRFFTNGGVREYEFKAPPELKDFIETDAEAFERISNCNHKGSSLILKKYLALKWLVDPPPDSRLKAHLWDVRMSGLTPGRKATVWNQQTGAVLLEAAANHFGNVDISLVLRNKDMADSLLVGLDEGEFLSSGQFQELPAGNGTKIQDKQVAVIMNQTMLTEIDHVEFDKPVESLTVEPSGINYLLKANMGGQLYTRNLPDSQNFGSTRSASTGENTMPVEDFAQKGLAMWQGGKRKFMVLSKQAEKINLVSQYSARSALDLSVDCDNIFVQVSDDGFSASLFQKGIPQQSGDLSWENSTKDKNYG